MRAGTCVLLKTSLFVAHPSSSLSRGLAESARRPFSTTPKLASRKTATPGALPSLGPCLALFSCRLLCFCPRRFVVPRLREKQGMHPRRLLALAPNADLAVSPKSQQFPRGQRARRDRSGEETLLPSAESRSSRQECPRGSQSRARQRQCRRGHCARGHRACPE